MEIRYEQAGDQDAIHTVQSEAFGQPNEAELVENLRASGKALLSMVAVLEEKIVGHVLFSLVHVRNMKNEGEEFEAVGLAPVAVLPGYQREGIGSQLIREALAELRKTGHELVFVLGHPEYYPRFGFVSTAKYDIGCEYNVSPEVFMVLELQQGAIAGRTGVVYFAEEFRAV